jgi:hypothetical protein
MRHAIVLSQEAAMANYQGTARSNFFRVTDVVGLRQWVSSFEVSVQVHPANPEYAMLFPTTDDGGWPTWRLEDEETGQEVEFDPVEHICPFLAEGEVVILIEIGAEKLNYVSGFARAFTWDGRHIALSLSDIYGRVEKELGIPQEQFADATYLSLPRTVALAAFPEHI